jgi:hypothetical protein
MLLSLDGGRNPIEAMSMLSYLVSRDSRLVTRFQIDAAAARDAASRARRSTGAPAPSTRLVVEERRRAVVNAHAQKEQVLARLRTEESGTSQQLAALEEKARRLQRLVDTLSLQKRGLAPPPTSAACRARCRGRSTGRSSSASGGNVTRSFQPIRSTMA